VELNAVVEETLTVVRGVRPDHLEMPTPCRDWDVRTLANHLLHVVEGLRLAGLGEAVPDDLWARDAMSPDWADRFAATADAAVAAWSAPAAWQRTVAMSGSAVPATVLASMFGSDLVLHGWDLARSTGQDLPGSGAELTLRFLLETGDQGRAMGLYADPVPVADTAPALTRAVALSGRDPQWTPLAAGPEPVPGAGPGAGPEAS
jgi:uncharacterized protein (TIGR03086 family)